MAAVTPVACEELPSFDLEAVLELTKDALGSANSDMGAIVVHNFKRLTILYEDGSFKKAEEQEDYHYELCTYFE